MFAYDNKYYEEIKQDKGIEKFGRGKMRAIYKICIY